jgi:single-stranded-DNA-specific exonuclease
LVKGGLIREMAIYTPLMPETAGMEYHINILQIGLGISRVAARLLVNRGITDIGQAASFLNPSLESLHDPYLLPDMDKAVKRIENAIALREPIVIYGDYDVDGITAASMLFLFLKERGAEVEVYIPNRYTEGYGMNCEAVEVISGRGAKLVITVDCGITSIEEVELAKQLGMDVIITDHHTCGSALPNAAAVVNPARAGHEYPFRSLAGVGVAAKLVQAMAGIDGIREYLDLIALGTVADVVPLLDENRTFTAKGLEKMKTDPNIGLDELIKAAGLQGDSIDASRIAFGLAPRLNAAGRMADASLGVSLLTTRDRQEAAQIAQELNEQNRSRQQIENDMIDECRKRVMEGGNLSRDRIIVLDGENWHTGVIGIAASKISEMFYRPCILISRQGDVGVGSARSIEGFNIYTALNSFSHLFVKFGGHEMAAGFTIPVNLISELKQQLAGYCNNNLDCSLLNPREYYDDILATRDITMSLIQELKQMEPFGAGNPYPKFLFSDVEVNNCRAVGNEGKHLKMAVSIEQRLWDAIGFGFGWNKDYLEAGSSKLDIIAALEENVWNGIKKIQLNVKSMKAALTDHKDIDGFLEPFYLKFFDAFFEGIMYNKTDADVCSYMMDTAVFKTINCEDAVSYFEEVRLGNLILTNTPEGGRWALARVLEREPPWSAFEYGYFQNTRSMGLNAILLAPCLGKVPYNHYERIYLLDQEIPLYSNLPLLEKYKEKVYIINGWTDDDKLFDRASDRLKLSRHDFVVLYRWLYSRRGRQNIWPDTSTMLHNYKQAAAQDINMFQLRLMLGVFHELEFIKVSVQPAYISVECNLNPRNRELMESKLYQCYMAWMEKMISRGTKEDNKWS